MRSIPKSEGDISGDRMAIKKEKGPYSQTIHTIHMQADREKLSEKCGNGE